jgi:hypothetical protein
MTPASWLRSSSTRRPYSNMFSEMSGGKSMNIRIKIVNSSIQMGISMLFMRQVGHCVRKQRAQRSKHRDIRNGPNDIRHPSWESHGVTCSAVSTTATPKVWAITAPACHGQSKRGYTFFVWQPCRYTTDIDSMNIIWWFHTLLNMAIDVKIIYLFKMVIFQLQHHLQLTYYKNPWQSLGNDHHSASCWRFQRIFQVPKLKSRPKVRPSLQWHNLSPGANFPSAFLSLTETRSIGDVGGASMRVPAIGGG